MKMDESDWESETVRGRERADLGEQRTQKQKKKTVTTFQNQSLYSEIVNYEYILKDSDIFATSLTTEILCRYH